MIDYRSVMKENADPKFAEFHSKLMPGKEGVIGVRMPVLRKLAGQIVRDDWRSYLRDVPECYDEEMLRGLIIATAPMSTDERILLSDGFMEYIDNWATCDAFCGSWKFPEEDSEMVWNHFRGMIESDDEFPMRVSLILRMGHFEDADHTRILLEDIASHDNEGYYYRMGAAWTVAECYVHHPEMTRGLLESGRLCAWTQNKSIQKIRESFRVSAEDKDSLLELKAPL